MKEGEKYNGWKNYETWCVALWLDNDRDTYRYCRNLAAECRQAAAICDQVVNQGWQLEEAARFLLAEQLRDENTADTYLEGPGMYSDLLNAAFAEVDWLEIAEHFLDGIDDKKDARTTGRADGDEQL